MPRICTIPPPPFSTVHRKKGTRRGMRPAAAFARARRSYRIRSVEFGLTPPILFPLLFFFWNKDRPPVVHGALNIGSESFEIEYLAPTLDDTSLIGGREGKYRGKCENFEKKMIRINDRKVGGIFLGELIHVYEG